MVSLDTQPAKRMKLWTPPRKPAERVVWCWNEWDPLEEVIVGTAHAGSVPPSEPGHLSKVWHMPNTVDDMGKMRPKEKVDKAQAELDNFAQVLADRGIVVRRPEHVSNTSVTAPYWHCPLMNGWTCPRDTLLVVGREIIEAPLSWRSRVYEKFAYRTIFEDYHARDPNFLWSSAPHPSVPDSLFRPGYHTKEMTVEKRLEQINKREYVTVEGVEPVFDAADAIRCGKDVFVLHSHTCNVLGFEWMKRQLARQDVRCHLIHMPSVHNPSHVDASIMPLRPPTKHSKGVLLTAPPAMDSDVIPIFEENNWEILQAPEPDDWMKADPDYKGKSSKWICCNVLPLGPNTVVVCDHDTALIKALEERRFECVKVPFKNVIEFGGGIHCGTQDVRRSGDLQSYFPTIDAMM
eukprot:TRINITY_DN21475_c0_g1_i1.p1 TRINITY_DN21475_c0_g1~~TRINITY_DN21475_c0_g1_i1.p1  ORF type:complete len:405 (+),score=94.38 TRINITY_DN21475_c0_g1_i1:83-1297(+)